VVAARLAENSSLRILVVEAGGDDRKDPRVYDVVRHYGEFFGTSLDWNWQTDAGRSLHGYVRS
jgi:choline dehydrogenase